MVVLIAREDYSAIEPALQAEIDNYIRLAEHAPFYRTKLGNRKITTETFYNVPLTYDHELMDDYEDFVACPDRVVQVSVSGGTYGKRKFIFRTREDIEKSVAVAAEMFLACGVKRGDKVAILQPFDLWNIGHIALRALQEIGALSCPLGLSATDEDVLQFLRDLECNVIYATPSRALRLAELSQQKGCGRDIRVTKALCAGEPISPAHREVLRDFWNAEIYGIYGSEETDGLAAECKVHRGYHLFDNSLILEILDPQSLQPAEKNSGVSVVTKLGYTGTVLIRYLLGDIVEIETEPCPCGLSSPRITVHGRMKETLWLYDGVKLPLTSVEDAIRAVLGYLPVYQIVREGTAGRDNLLVIIISRQRAAGLEKQIEKALIDSTQEIHEAFNFERNLNVKVKIYSDSSLLFRSSRGKIPRVVDRRSKARGQGPGR